MRGHLPRRGRISVQQPGRAAMGAVLSAAVQGRLKRITDHWVHEPRPVTDRQHLGTDKAPRQPRGDGRRHARNRRGVAQFTVIPQHGQRLRQAKRVRTQAPHPGDHQPRDSLQSPRQQLRRLQCGQRPTAKASRPQQLGQVQRITAASRIDGRAQLIAHLAAGRCAHRGTHGLFAQQRRAQNRRRRGAHGQQRSTHHCRVALTQGHQNPRRQSLQPRRQVSQPAQRGLISPMRVIDGDQERPAGGQVYYQPVQAVQHRKPTVTSRRHGELAGQQRPDRGRRPGQQRLTLTLPRSRHAPLEQLAHHPERETRLQLRSPRPHDLVAKLIRPRARHLNQRRLANTGPALEHQHPAAVLQQHLDRRQLTLALPQPPHQASVPLPPCSVHRRPAGKGRPCASG